MGKTFTGTMELYATDVTRNRNGRSQVLIFECEEDLELEKEMIEFRDTSVSINITSEEEDAPDVELVGTMEVDVKTRKASSVRRLSLILKGVYKKEFEHSAIDLKFHDCKVVLNSVDEELDFESDQDVEQYDS